MAETASSSSAHGNTPERQMQPTENVEPNIPSVPSGVKQSLESCCICLASVTSATRAVATPCLHACFDFSCLVTWLEGAQSTCPVCKQRVEIVKYNFDPNGTGFQKYKVKSSGSSNSTKTAAPRNLHRRAEIRRLNNHTSSVSLEGLADDIPRRRFVYKHRLRSFYIGSNSSSRFKTYSPAIFRTSPTLVSKAKSFIRRELEVFDWTEGNREWLVEYIVGILKTVRLKHASGKAEDLVEEFLGSEFAGVFLHELDAFLRSPFERVRDWDRWAKYTMKIPEDLGEVQLDEG
ncbi:hypothetical protein TWF481_004062 [Arthrobotrys musiformis]|uniref:RING-type E3 ubiquitin transferase n=1 Tax=Arthrobotrys musiformis TaxID=47236 RepID=A0AAV9WIF9_9PEZI